MLAGLAGTVVPALPGLSLIFIAVFFYALFTGFAQISIWTIVILGVIVILISLFDYLAGIYGAKKFGGSKWGILGAFLGGAVGLLVFNIWGLIAGTFLGAAGVEILAGKSYKDAGKVGLGTLFGFLASMVMKVIVGLIIVIAFTLDLIF